MDENYIIKNCKLCSETFSDDSGLHKHLRKHKLTIAEYYHTHFPRYDLLTSEIIEFKTKEQYFSSFFASKENLESWFRFADKKSIIIFLDKFFEDRKNRKNLEWIPTQVELRSLVSPSIITINKFVNYNEYCESQGLKSRFFKSQRKDCKISRTNPIVIDTREQSPLIFDPFVTTKVSGLKYGDYKLEDSSEDKLVIERKSLSDFASTFSTDIERFKNEMRRALLDKFYMVVVVEASMSDALKFKKNNLVSPRLKITEEYVFRNVRDLIQSTKDIQFLFVSGREEASRVTEKLLYEGHWQTHYDLQLLYDSKLF